ncbi:hypothetical protein BDR26DRAFT_852539 [Obelidium mucronatum]|nr:hypothetical protein BDR26DRAFT_852539 [Obelidium mucronatum]
MAPTAPTQDQIMPNIFISDSSQGAKEVRKSPISLEAGNKRSKDSKPLSPPPFTASNKRAPSSDTYGEDVVGRRTMQNRLAQRNFRLRKDLRIKELEVRVSLLSQGGMADGRSSASTTISVSDQTEELLAKVAQLQERVQCLEAENCRLREERLVEKQNLPAWAQPFYGLLTQTITSTSLFSVSGGGGGGGGGGAVVGGGFDPTGIFQHLPSPATTSTDSLSESKQSSCEALGEVSRARSFMQTIL